MHSSAYQALILEGPKYLLILVGEGQHICVAGPSPIFLKKNIIYFTF